MSKSETPFDQFIEVLNSSKGADKSTLEAYLSDELKKYKVRRLQYKVEKHNYGVSVTIGDDVVFRFDSDGKLIEVFNYRFS